MAGSAKGLQAVYVPWVLPWLALQRRDVVALQSARPSAHEATPAIPLEYRAADGLPTPLIEAGMVTAHSALALQHRLGYMFQHHSLTEIAP